MKCKDMNGLHDTDVEDVDDDLMDDHLAIVLSLDRHKEQIEGLDLQMETWRMKDRMKTVSVALVLCLNVGVDPPDVIKLGACAKRLCWIDPTKTSPVKALELIGGNLQKQYERWQPRARYKQCLDPSVDEIRKLCTSLRKSAKDERVLFHYSGHGVPCPTINGEVWVFNKAYTQYIPLPLYDLQMWMGQPSIYVFDCSHAGIIADSFASFLKQTDSTHTDSAESSVPVTDTEFSLQSRDTILLAACSNTELLPQNPELPADLFTSCLTTPIQMALRWYCLQGSGNLVSNLDLVMVEKIPGQLNDRRTMLGELNWIFTAVTDTIAWNTLPRELFQTLFRQDLLVASLFRNFLLAQRVMQMYNCEPISIPALPLCHQHPMWRAWDMTLDLCLQQLPLDRPGDNFLHCPFFSQQLTAFQVWLNYATKQRPAPEQLPIVLQVLLSQVHRLRALDLLGRFLDLGPWAVNLALSVGIFPYILKLLQSSTKELQPLLVFLWAKIMAVDSSCQSELVKDRGHKYFLTVLADHQMSSDHRTMAAFVLAKMVDSFEAGQEACLQSGIISICLEQLENSSPDLRKWLALCLGKVWTRYDDARWHGVRDSAGEKLSALLGDGIPEVRAAAVYALGTFIYNGTDQHSDHASAVELDVGKLLVPCGRDGSPLVRKELVVALSGLVEKHEHNFSLVASHIADDDNCHEWMLPMAGETDGGGCSGSCKTPCSSSIPGSYPDGGLPPTSLHRCSSTTSITCGSSGLQLPYSNIYMSVLQTLVLLASDPQSGVRKLAKRVVNFIWKKVCKPQSLSTDPNTDNIMHSSSPPCLLDCPSRSASPVSHRPRFGEAAEQDEKLCDEEEAVWEFTYLGDRTSETDAEMSSVAGRQLPSQTQLFAWSCKQFLLPVMQLPADQDPVSEEYHRRQRRYLHNSHLRTSARIQQHRAGFSQLDDQISLTRSPSTPLALRCHPYDNYITIADRDSIRVWDWERGETIASHSNGHRHHGRISYLEYLNPHDQTLLLVGTDDGCVRIWNNHGKADTASELITSFAALTDMLPVTKGSGLVTHWEQETSTLICAGDVQHIVLWDLQTEMKNQPSSWKQQMLLLLIFHRRLRTISVVLELRLEDGRELLTGADSCVTCLASDAPGRSLLVAGCGDGSVRLFDRRLSPYECHVMTLREHDGKVLSVHLQSGHQGGKILSASSGGDLRFWDPRFTESISCQRCPHGFSAVSAHNSADLIACGSYCPSLLVYNESGDTLSTVRYHEGFLGQRIGITTCLSFHPHQIKLAAGMNDGSISVYANPGCRSRA